jgi:hypothetical protein
MESIIRQSTDDAKTSLANRTKDLFEEWMLLVFPVAIVLVSVSMQPDTGIRPWAPLLQAFGAISLVGAAFYESWGIIVKRQWMPGVVVPFAWLSCGAFVGYPTGRTGSLLGATLGFAVWILCRYSIKRTRIRRMLNGGGLATKPN